MNTTQLKAYAPRARKDFIEAVKARAAKFGITESDPAEMMVRDDVAMIYGEAYPKQVYQQREGVLELIKANGFEPAMEAMAYTWFNRLMALRYMELHGFLDHGYRVLSHPEGASSPEILQHARHVDLPDLDQAQVTELLLAGNKDEELYRHLLLAQCHALHQAMPFLFEAIDDATELLLPDNLLHSDSLIRKMVSEIPEQDWETVEVIGWLYQFYISEKKDQVIGKVVASEDIPAATQLFTPNWIVKYMVQNSLGAQWLATYPDSKLKGQMEYYIEPAEQTDEVNAQLATITPSQLNPEKLTLIDPASGSGHILVEAYELFKAIYLERGYRQRDVPRLILEKNLFGLDIDERAAQLTGFALMMKGRADDRRLFERGVKLNVMALVDSAGFDAEVLAPYLHHSQLSSRHSGEGRNPECSITNADLIELKQLFEHAATFGSLIQVPEGLAEKLPALKQLSKATSQDLFVSEALKRLAPLVQQAKLLAAQYDAVVANPPYMGSKFHTSVLKDFAKDYFPEAKSDLFSCFIERGYTLAKDAGHSSMVTMQSWMFLSSFERMRRRMLKRKTLTTMAHLGPGGFAHASAMVVQTTAVVLQNREPPKNFKPVFFRLLRGDEEEKRSALANSEERHATIAQDEFESVPGSPVTYWISRRMLSTFADGVPLSNLAQPRQGLATMDNDTFLRRWPEVSLCTSLEHDWGDPRAREHETAHWAPYNKGGDFRKWYGNQDFLVNWAADGKAIKKLAISRYGSASKRVVNEPHYFLPSITWSKISGVSTFRDQPAGAIFDVAGMSLFPDEVASHSVLLGLLNSTVATTCLEILSPTLKFEAGHIGAIPMPTQLEGLAGYCLPLVTDATKRAQGDWDAYERSWDFQSLPLLSASTEPTPNLESNYSAWITQIHDNIAEMKRLEEENNRLFIDAYGLQDELIPDVPIEQITLTVNPAYRYGGNLSEDEKWTRFRQDTMEELVSYAIGCMMGRYSLDAPGLIYAHSGNEGFDPSRYPTFPADDDGIVPLTDTEWFIDDAANRIIEFISLAWPSDPAGAHLEENLTFLADNLKPKANETSRETIRRYLCDRFFKDHLKTYKKRPIYWLFSSGKHKALQCLVYLHRYNRSTLARMRMDYVVPLLGRLNARIESLSHDIEAATTTAQANKLRRESEKRKKQLEELRTYDEKLRHTADQRITLDLDDGVKVNYGKFGDLLAEVKAVTGKYPK